MATLGPSGLKMALQSWQARTGMTRGASPEELSAEGEALLELVASPMEWPATPIVRLFAACEFAKSQRAFVQERIGELQALGAGMAAETLQRETMENAPDTGELDALLSARYKREKPSLDSLYPMTEPADMTGAGVAELTAYSERMEAAAELAGARVQFATRHAYSMDEIRAEQARLTRLCGMAIAGRDKLREAKMDEAARASGTARRLSPDEFRQWQRRDPLGLAAAQASGRVFVDSAA